MSQRANYQKLSAPAFHALLAFEKTIETTTVDRHILDFVKIRASQLNGCLFCLDMHSKEARTHDERELRLYHLSVWRESSLFSPQERAALEWTELLTKLGSHGAEDADYAKVAAQFSEKEICDLTLAVSSINLWNRLGIAFRPTPGSLDIVMGLDKIGLR
ncbi:carboxymuconolactone decarboxylase family protein [soil metagenome]